MVKKRRRHKHLPKQSKGRFLGRFLGIVLAFLALFIFLDMRLRPVIGQMAEYQAKIFAARTINQAILNELGDSELKYSDIIHITNNNQGGVSSIQSDMLNINLIKARLGKAIVVELENISQQIVYMPLGTLLGNEFFSGRGPNVEIRIIPVGYVQTEITNQFVSAGINQTLHQVMLTATVHMTAIVPGYSVSTQTTTNFCIAETVIVGDIPEAYTQINGDTSPIISKINDYKADQ